LPAARRLVAAAREPSSAYGAYLAHIQTAQTADEAAAPKPIGVARLVARILRTRSPKLRYAVGRLAQRIVIPLKRWLPQRWFGWILATALGVPASTRRGSPG
jgi:hypothetical protein